MGKKEKLVMLINSLEGGGAEKVFSLLAREFGHDFSVTLITLDNREVMHLPPGDISFKCVDSKIIGNKFIKFVLSLRRIKPTIVLSFLTRSNQFNILSRLFWPHKTIISERSTASGRFTAKGLYNRINRWLIRHLYPFADCIIANSRGGEVDLIKKFAIPRGKVVTIHNPFDIEEIQAKGKSPKGIDEEFICSIGRLHDAKRFDLLIQAYALSGVKAKLFILGEGHRRRQLEKLITLLALNDRVKLIGYKSNPYTYLKQCKFFVLSSQREGFPNGLVEALILEKAVIATNCKSGPREILDPEYTGPINNVHWGSYGMLIPPNDEKILSNAISLMDQLAQKRVEFEGRGLKRGQDFHIDEVYQSYKRVLLNGSTN